MAWLTDVLGPDCPPVRAEWLHAHGDNGFDVDDGPERVGGAVGRRSTQAGPVLVVFNNAATRDFRDFQEAFMGHDVAPATKTNLHDRLAQTDLVVWIDRRHGRTSFARRGPRGAALAAVIRRALAEA
jgi:hypothetical protein